MASSSDAGLFKTTFDYSQRDVRALSRSEPPVKGFGIGDNACSQMRL